MALKANGLTQAFYERNAPSFSETRARAWPGWERVREAIDLPERADVLDIGCGNLRFERFVQQTHPQARFTCADNCAALAAGAQAPDITFVQADLIAALADDALMPAIGDSGFDLCAAFGFMHHIPLRAWRQRLLSDMVALARPGGFIAVALWQFLNSPRLAEKARIATETGCARHGIAFDDPHDRLLGWQGESDAFRYCHHFTEDEIDALAAAVPGAREIARFSADGAEQLNRYLILQRSATSTR